MKSVNLNDVQQWLNCIDQTNASACIWVTRDVYFSSTIAPVLRIGSRLAIETKEEECRIRTFVGSGDTEERESRICIKLYFGSTQSTNAVLTETLSLILRYETLSYLISLYYRICMQWKLFSDFVCCWLPENYNITSVKNILQRLSLLEYYMNFLENQLVQYLIFTSWPDTAMQAGVVYSISIGVMSIRCFILVLKTPYCGYTETCPS